VAFDPGGETVGTPKNDTREWGQQRRGRRENTNRYVPKGLERVPAFGKKRQGECQSPSEPPLSGYQLEKESPHNLSHKDEKLERKRKRNLSKGGRGAREPKTPSTDILGSIE